MTVRLVGNATIVLEDAATIEDADPLLRLLLAHPAAMIDWRRCTQVHAAIIQILLISNAIRIGPPESAFLRDVIEPAIVRSRERGFPGTA